MVGHTRQNISLAESSKTLRMTTLAPEVCRKETGCRIEGEIQAGEEEI